LENLIKEKEFPGKNITAMRNSLKEGINKYCKDRYPACKNPNPDPNWPDKAKSNVTL
jgi:hypothetical protein